jgi:predicted nucleic acid-binding protein
MSEEILVLDASVGVKWFLAEHGSDQADLLLSRCAAGEVSLLAPTHFMHEVLSVVRRDFGSAWIVPAWEMMVDARLGIAELGEDLVAEAAAQSQALGCSFYDSLAPAVASLLGATLVSADSRTHGAYPGVRLIG